MRTFLHQKRVSLPLLVVALAAIVVLVLLPLAPRVQSSAQALTKAHPVLAKIAPAAFQPPDLGVPNTGDWLVIPEATIKLPINEGSSIDVLIKDVGVWHQTGDLQHNYVIAGHRLQYFRSVDQTLFHLDMVKPGDNGIYIVHNGAVQQYQAVSSTVVDPTDVQILDPTPAARLTIYTCNDFNNHSRLVLTAVPYMPSD